MNRVTLHASRYVVGALLIAAISRLLTRRSARATGPEPGSGPSGGSTPE
jgi:hypothetical protein